MGGGGAMAKDLDEKTKSRCITCLCVGTALMDFTSHIASQATPAYAIQLLGGGNMEAVATLISYCTATGAVVEFFETDLDPHADRDFVDFAINDVGRQAKARLFIEFYDRNHVGWIEARHPRVVVDREGMNHATPRHRQHFGVTP